MTTEERNALRAMYEAATAGPWEPDTIETDGSYGCGDDTHKGFNAYAMHAYATCPADSKVIFDSSNSDCGEIHTDYDEIEGTGSAWDEIARRNFDFIAAAHNALPSLLADSERAEALEGMLRRLVEEYKHEYGQAAAAASIHPDQRMRDQAEGAARVWMIAGLRLADILTEARAMVDQQEEGA